MSALSAIPPHSHEVLAEPAEERRDRARLGADPGLRHVHLDAAPGELAERGDRLAATDGGELLQRVEVPRAERGHAASRARKEVMPRPPDRSP
jgi:hypothetical protein